MFFLHLNKDFWSGITSLYLLLTSPAVLCMQNSVNSIRNTSLCGSHPSPVVFACKTAWLASELLVSMGSNPDLWFCAFKKATLGPELHVSMGPRPHIWFCECKTACLASELLVSMCPSSHLWCLEAKQQLLGQNNKSLWVADLTWGFCMQNSAFRTWPTSLYGFLT